MAVGGDSCKLISGGWRQFVNLRRGLMSFLVALINVVFLGPPSLYQNQTRRTGSPHRVRHDALGPCQTKCSHYRHVCSIYWILINLIMCLNSLRSEFGFIQFNFFAKIENQTKIIILFSLVFVIFIFFWFGFFLFCMFFFSNYFSC